MSREDWQSAIASLKPGLTYIQAAAQLGQSYAITRKWMLRFGYQSPDARGNSKHRREEMVREYAKANWETPNIAIALKLGKTREAVRQARKILASGTFVEARGRKAA